MALTIVNSTNIESAPFANIFSTIDTRTNIADPRSKGTATKDRVFVYDIDPLTKSLNFGDFPYIIVNLPTLIYSNVSANGTEKMLAWTHEIIVRSSRQGASGFSVDLGRTDILAIGDDLNQTFNKVSNRQAFGVVNMHKMNLTKTATGDFVVDQKAIYQATYTLSYMTRLVVSV